MDKKSNLNFKTVVFDLDGTLLNSQKQILTNTKDVLNNLRKNDISLAIATGRPWYFSMAPWYEINSNLPIISCNGALVYDPQQKKVLFVNPIAKTVAKEVLQLLLKAQVNFLIYTDTKMFKYQALATSNWFEWLDNQLNQMPENSKFTLESIKSDFDINTHQVIKFLIIVSEGSINMTLEELKTHLSLFAEHVYMISSQKTVLDIMPIGSNKGQGLEVLAQNKLLDLETTLVFGDEINDVPMFGAAKYSVAMGQSNPTIQTKATFTTDDHDHDGIANFFKKHYNN